MLGEAKPGAEGEADEPVGAEVADHRRARDAGAAESAGGAGVDAAEGLVVGEGEGVGVMWGVGSGRGARREMKGARAGKTVISAVICIGGGKARAMSRGMRARSGRRGVCGR